MHPGFLMQKLGNKLESIMHKNMGACMCECVILIQSDNKDDILENYYESKIFISRLTKCDLMAAVVISILVLGLIHRQQCYPSHHLNTKFCVHHVWVGVCGNLPHTLQVHKFNYLNTTYSSRYLRVTLLLWLGIICSKSFV